MSPLFNLLNNNGMNNSFGATPLMNNNPIGNMLNMVNQFNQFKNTFQGNPEQQVKQLLNSGKMSQQQFNQLSQVANQLQSFLK